MPIWYSHDIKAKGCISTMSGKFHLRAMKSGWSSRNFERDTGRITGSIPYRPKEETDGFTVAGPGIRSAKIQALQMRRCRLQERSIYFARQRPVARTDGPR